MPAIQETYQVARNRELGFRRTGIGKRYSVKDLNAFKDQTFEAPLFKDGTLVFDTEYFSEIIGEVLGTWSKTSYKTVSKARMITSRIPKLGQRFAREENHRLNDAANLEIFGNTVGVLTGRIPAVWRDTEAIIKTYRDVAEAGALLTQDLIRFGLIHPVTAVRTALCETQELTANQIGIVGYMQIDSQDKDLNHRINATGIAGAPYFHPILLPNEFGGYRPTPKQPGELQAA